MYNKRIFFPILFAFLLPVTIKAQDSTYVKWLGYGKKTGDKEYELHLNGKINFGWSLYTKNKQVDGLESLNISFIDSYILKIGDQQLTGRIKTITDPIFDNKEVEVAYGNIEIIQKIKVEAEVPAKIKAILSYSVSNKETFLSEETRLDINMEGGLDMSSANRILIPTIDLKRPVNACGGVESTGNKGLVTIFFLGFVGGLLALFTPCVFPMVPLTVSFFTKKATTKKKGILNALIYGFFIFLIYVLLSVPFYFIDSANPEILNSVSTNPWLNVIFFVIFVFFALSFFGLFELTLPSSFTNRADSKAGTGDVVGIFFMALTLAIVSFSCTGPILGSLLVGSLKGGAVQLTAGMGGFGLALALPFALFALFPNWLQSLPKSGGWLNSVKVVLGFIEVGLAFKFLSSADLIMHWGILKREVFIGIWILMGIGITLYLLGKIRFPHDSLINKLSKGRTFLAMIFALFTIYLIPGLTHSKWANLSLISGFPPPLYYSIYQKGNSDCVLDLNCFHDYETGIKMARTQHKPILIDFTGYACTNCRSMEENVWSDEGIYTIMKEKFIVISLYVDDQVRKLPAGQQFTYKNKEGKEKEILTVGDKWATFETENFKNNAQPLYAILNTDEVLLTNPVGTKNVKEYKKWLECGLAANEQIKH